MAILVAESEPDTMRMGPLTPKYERQCFDAFTASANSASMPAARMLAANIDAAGAARSSVKAFLNGLLGRKYDGIIHAQGDHLPLPFLFRRPGRRRKWA